MKLCELDDSCEYVVVTFDLSGGEGDYSSIESELGEKGVIKSLGGEGAPHNTFIYKGNAHEINSLIESVKNIFGKYNSVNRLLIAHSKAVEITGH